MPGELKGAIPRYPPDVQGLPVVAPEKLLETQQEVLNSIADRAIVTAETYDRVYRPVIERFAAFVHLLPASESHHHAGAGGLLRHSLEVGFWALQSADKILLDAARTPVLRREMEPRWQLAVFLAGLCHDLGKPVTDLVVSDRNGALIWSPIVEDLCTWAGRSGVDTFILRWRPGRSRQHTSITSLIAVRIIGDQAFGWIAEAGIELVIWLMESLQGNAAPDNPLHDIVIRSDRTSVERDLRTTGAVVADTGLGIPVEHRLAELMHRFVQEGVWLINEPGARLWNIEGHLYLVWPKAGEEIFRQVQLDKLPGIPRTIDGLLDLMIERRLAMVREGGRTDERLWRIAPASLAQKISDIRLTAIRLRDHALVSPSPLATVNGKVFDGNAAEEQVASDAMPQTILSPEVPDARGTMDYPDERDRDFGEALTWLAGEFKAGVRQWEIDAWKDADGRLLLRWPEVFHGCDLSPKAVLEDLSRRGWLWQDPLRPLKKIHQVEIEGTSVRAICLERVASDRFVQELGDVTGRQIPLWSASTSESAPLPPKVLDMDKAHGQKSEDPSRSLLDQIMNILMAMPVEAQAEGWFKVQKSEVMAACRKADIRITHARFLRLGLVAPDRFVVDGTEVRFRRIARI